MLPEAGSKGLVLVDLDGTLIDAPGSERRFIAELMRKDFLCPAQWWAATMFLLRNGTRFRRDVARKNKGYLAGLRADQVEALAAQFVAQTLIHELRAFMLERLQRHLNAGAKVVLLTGAPDFLATPLARHLGLAACVATICHRAGDRFTAQPPVQHPLGWEKRRLVEVLCKREGCVPDDRMPTRMPAKTCRCWTLSVARLQ